eukprot:gnl/TRDRNA2_/TRDRNA2_62252_c0_seq1.p1 gnl/TRDRNA2_/TRDRNA2_62252_c0~~gnl/TRDRNA2_/TRDRNA2_62252_c0_seq1.p1  ORF type:complete len:239 (-),score=14.07 gnl/TRDRNA2_/TRDRNA2_62252_c0_seq1:91-807(-)
MGLRVVGVWLDGGQLLPASLRPKRILVFGDSTAEGYGAAETNCTAYFIHKPTLHTMSATAAWPFIFARELDAEVSVVGWSTCGWTQPGALGVPAFPSSWELVFASVARSWARHPDYVVVVHGANDALNPVVDGAVEAAVRAWVPRVLHLLPRTMVIIVVPFGGFRKEELQRGAASPGVYFVDLGTKLARGLTNWGSTPEACDGIHPYAWRHRDLALALVQHMPPLSHSHFFSRGSLTL